MTESILTTDSDQVLFFTSEVVSRLTAGLELIRHDGYTIVSRESMSSEDSFVGVSKKKKNRRSSGEILILPGSFLTRERVSEEEGQEQDGISSHLICRGGDRSDDYYSSYESFIDYLRMYKGITEPDHDRLHDIYDSVKNLPSCQTHIYLSHDGRSLSIQEKRFFMKVNRHYQKERVLYGYTTENHAKITLHKQTRKGKEGYYLRSFGSKMTNGERTVPALENFPSHALFYDVMSLFLGVEREDLSEEYERRRHPVSSLVFPDVEPDAIAPLLSLPGWRHEENNTLTKALHSALGGKKPRKDFVRSFARHINSLPVEGKERKMTSVAVPHALRGAVSLITIARENDMGFDMEDFVIKILQGYSCEMDEERETFNSSSGFLYALVPPLVDPFGREINTTGVPQVLSTKLMEMSFHYLSAFVGVPLLKKIMSAGDSFNGRAVFQNSFSQITRYYSNTLSDLTRMIQQYVGIGREESEMIRSAYLGNKGQKKGAVEAIRLRVSDAERDLDQIFREDANWNLANTNGTLTGLHDVMSRYTRMNRGRGVLNDPSKETPNSPIKTLLMSDEPLSVKEGKDTYTWTYPEFNSHIVNWAGSLNNCMASYVSDVQEEDYELVFVEKNGKPYAALGLRSGRMMAKSEEDETLRRRYRYNQFYRKNNIPLASELEGKLLSHLENEVVSYAEKEGQVVEMNLVGRRG